MTSEERKGMEAIADLFERYLVQYYDARAKDDRDNIWLLTNCMYALKHAMMLSNHMDFYDRLVKAEREWDERYRLWSGTIDEEGKLREEAENADTD